MARLGPTRAAGPLAGPALVALLLAACDTTPPAAERSPHSRPVPATAPQAGTQPEPTGPPGPATPPAPATATGPADVAQTPAAPPAPPAEPHAPPPLPEYLEVVERFQPGQATVVRVLEAGVGRLAIETRNVRRLRIDRQRSPLSERRSVALFLDGQGIEWLPRSPVAEFERSRTGEWQPVRPDAP